jgi:hypothetical protein
MSSRNHAVGVLWEWQLDLEPGDVEVLPRAALLGFGPPDLSVSKVRWVAGAPVAMMCCRGNCTILAPSARRVGISLSSVLLQDVTVAPVELPEGSALHVLLAGELLAGWDFPRRQLYVEYRILFDPKVWRLLPRGRLGFKDTTHPRPGVIRVQSVSPSCCVLASCGMQDAQLSNWEPFICMF